MAPTLVESLSGVTVSPSGAIAVKLSDYVAGARGTLTTVSDADSVAGTVVKDTQTVAVPTSTSAGQYFAVASCSDSVVIPRADLPLEEAWEYQAFLGVKCVGEAPSNAQYGTTWARLPNVCLSSGIWVVERNSGGTTYNQIRPHLLRSIFPHYYLAWVGQVWPAVATSSWDRIAIRAWGITGGTTEWYLDTLYVIPYGATGADAGWTFEDFFSGGGDTFDALGFSSNGTFFPDPAPRDTDATDWIGAQSLVLPRWIGATGWQDYSAGDVQEANREPTVLGVSDGTFFNDEETPTHVITAGDGGVYISPHTIEDEPFNTNFTTVSGTRYNLTPGNRWWSDGPNNFVGLWGGTIIPGWRGTGDGVIRCLIPANQANGGGVRAAGGLILGLVDDPNNSSDSRNRKPKTLDIWSFIVNAKFRSTALRNFDILFGTEESAPQNAQVGADVDITSAGVITLKLLKRSTRSGGVLLTTFASTTISGTYTANTYLRVKVERRGHMWRAKCWFDGSSEPGSWQVEAGEPQNFRNSASSTWGFISYPWSSDWPGNVNHDVIVDDVRNYDTEYPAVYAFPANSEGQYEIEMDNYKIEYDSGATAPDDIEIEMEKWDSSSTMGTAVVPYGALRVIDWGRAIRRFNFDDEGPGDGYNLRAWKLGGPPLEFAKVGDIFERRSHGKVVGFYAIAPMT